MEDEKKVLTREEAEDMLEGYFYAKKDWLDMLNREDWVNWSPENEDKEWEEYKKVRDEIIDLMVGEEE